METTVRISGSMEDIPAQAWDALVEPSARPVLDWDFLHVLEASGTACPASGWTPRHLTVWSAGRLVAAAPAYVRTDSFGEFMYNDETWPLLTARFGVPYFPRLVLTVPFTPARGPRVLVAPGEDAAALRRIVAQAAVDLAAVERCSGVNALFVRDEDLAGFQALGFAAGAGVQFHWKNEGFRDFDDFLARFDAHRRHALRRERAAPAREGVSVRTLAGAELTPEVMAFVARCYAGTAARYGWDGPRLTDAFFALAGPRLDGRAEVVLAEQDGRPLAAAFNLRGPGTLYGRQWGAVEWRPFLHFNVCYYHSIERCIRDGVAVFEPGAGGEHKLARGFDPVVVRSAHRFLDPALHAAMARRLARETEAWESGVTAWRLRHHRDARGAARRGVPG